MREANERKRLIGDMLAGGLNPKIELRRRIEPGRPLRLACEGWIESRRSVSERTRESYGWRQVVIFRTFGETAPAEILPEDVIDWIGGLEESYEPGSIRQLVGSLRLMLDFCDGPNAARDRRVHLPRNDPAEVSPPDAPAVVAMLQALTVHVPAAITMELLGTRVSETLSLQRNDLREGAIRIRREATKARKPREIPTPQFDLRRHFYFAHHRQRQISPATREFLALCREMSASATDTDALPLPFIA